MRHGAHLKAVPDLPPVARGTWTRLQIARRLLELGDRQDQAETLCFKLFTLDERQGDVADRLQTLLHRRGLTRRARRGESHYGLTFRGRLVLAVLVAADRGRHPGEDRL